MSAAPPAWGLFEVVGLELEYPVVGADLAVADLVEPALARLAGRPASDVDRGTYAVSNELAAHVLELKTPLPLADLIQVEEALAAGVVRLSEILVEWGARLLPTGMHPFMRPAEGRLWRRSGRAIYEAYARIFPIEGHGWFNVQSCHVNLPFGRTEAETMRLHEAIALLVPYLPALAASSPVVEGEPGPFVDNRLAFYRANQARFPPIAGRVVPERATSFAQYRREILRPIYRALAGVPGAERLRHEWVNSRGAILRFMRRALELRVLDVQECVRMDVAIAAFVRGLGRDLVDRLAAGSLAIPERDLLVADFDRVVAEGTTARVAAPHLAALAGVAPRGGPVPAGELLAALVPLARARLAPAERPYLDLVARRLAGGSLAERIRAAAAREPARRRRATLEAIYRELADCLVANRVWE